MATFRPFRAFRPSAKDVATVSALPYDVLNTKEAAKLAEGNPISFLHVTKPEINNPSDKDVYASGANYFQELIDAGVFVQDENPSFYIYAQTMNGRTQFGLVGCVAVDEYFNNTIKKHELTRPDKEEDRRQHIRISGYHYEPVFLSYKTSKELDKQVARLTSDAAPIYDFTSNDGIRHQLWVVDNPKEITAITVAFAKMNALYIADGHHRSAAAAGVGRERQTLNQPATSDEFNYFVAVCFPENQLHIMDYNRLVKDLNGLSTEDFLQKLGQNFTVSKVSTDEPYKPQALHEFSMYLDGAWYKLTANENTYDDSDPIRALDVTVLSDFVLSPLLDITDLRNSKRIDFVGGIRGLGELKARVDSGEMQAAFALYPVSMEQLINIADSGQIMPPKTTWFEPKLRSGLFVHSLD